MEPMPSDVALGYQYLAGRNFPAARRVADAVLRLRAGDIYAMQLAGLAAYQDGDLAGAADCLRNVVDAWPDNAEAIAHLAVAEAQLGDNVAAERGFGRALALDPGHVDAHYNLGNLLHARGAFAAAANTFEAAVRLRPTFVEAWFNYANALRDDGRLADAVSAYERALELRPGYAKALNNLGNLLLRMRNVARAADVLEKAVTLRPDYAEAHYNLGNVRRIGGDFSSALSSYLRALEINPSLAKAHAAAGDMLRARFCIDAAVNHYRQGIHCFEESKDAHPPGRAAISGEFDLVRVWNNMGSCLVIQRNWADAEASFNFVLSRDPRNAVAINNLGVIRMAQGCLEEAREQFERALALDEPYAEAHSNLAAALQHAGEYELAHQHYERATTLDPRLADAHWNRSLLFLAQGDWQRGWSGYEWRWQRPDFCRFAFRCPPGSASSEPSANDRIDVPLWDGSALASRRIFVFTEQGIGDIVQFIRFASEASDRGGKVIVECPGKLIPILSSCRGVDSWIAQGTPVPPCDVQVPLLSIPAILGITSEMLVPAAYLSADLERVKRWKPVLESYKGFKIGVNWQGNPAYYMDRFRSLPLASFAPLARMSDVSLISLQQGFGAEQITDVEEMFRVERIEGDIDRDGAFLDTAAILTQLDLVVTSDTAVAHLAGAMGIKTWVVLPYAPDWRWGVSGDTVPWYPSVRLFRQRRPGEWKEVFVRIVRALRAEIDI